MVPVKVKVGWVPGGFAAWVPRPRTIVISENTETTERLIAHELVHVDQHERYGLGFYVRYFFGMFRSRFDHSRHPMEREAFKNENTPRFRQWAREVIRKME